MDPMSFGSASPGMGGSAELNEAMARRQTGEMGAAQQQTPAAPGFDPAAQPPQQGQPLPQGSSVIGVQGAPPTDPTAQPVAQHPFDGANVSIILKSMQNFLKQAGQISGAQ